jgi:hypothetical protein
MREKRKQYTNIKEFPLIVEEGRIISEETGGVGQRKQEQTYTRDRSNMCLEQTIMYQ